MKYIIALLLTSSILYSQSDTIYRYSLPTLKITLKENSGYSEYNFDKEKNLFYLYENNIIADTSVYKFNKPINDLSKISIYAGNTTWKAARNVGIAGGALGLIVGLFFVNGFKINSDDTFKTLSYFTLAGMLSGGVLGAVNDLMSPTYFTYSDFKGSPEQRKLYLMKILKENNK